MGTLKIKLHGNTIQELQLQIGQEYFGGRGDTCEIKLDHDKSFSRQHIKIYFNNDLWVVEFIAKYGSIFVGKEAHDRIDLKINPTFSVPPYEFEYSKNELEINNHQADGNNNSTPDSQQKMSEESPYLPRLKTDTNLIFEENQPSINVTENTVTVIQTTNKKGFLVQYNEKDKPSRSCQLTDEIFYVGRDEDNSIVLDHSRVSRRQFKVTKVVDKYFLQDLGSINGTFINGNKVSSTEPVQLISGDLITVLDFKLSFELRDPDFKEKFRKYQDLMPIPPQRDLFAKSNTSYLPTDYNPNLYDPTQAPPLPSQNFDAQEEDGVDSLNFFGLIIPLTSQNKMRMIIGVLAFFALIYGLNESTSTPTEANVENKPGDPFTKLSPEDQNYIKHTYSLAKSLFMKGDYSLAHSEIMKLHEKIPRYEDSQDLEKYITLALEAQKQSDLHTKIENEKQETETKIQNIVKHCNQLITNKTTAEELNECLGPALELNPEHPDIITLKVQVNKLNEERAIKAKEKAQYDLEVQQLKDQFLNAMKISELEPLKGIPILDEFMESTLPDPDKLKEKARKQKLYITGDIKNKVNRAIEKSKSFADSGSYKDAVMNLETAYRLDPENDQLKLEIDKYTGELRKKMQAIYQEAIVDENIGNVETAKEKWHKIMEQDVSNGEYYRKSQIKLGKYGVL